MPEPRSDENRDDFVSRCMSDEKSMSDFPDEEQRLAVCYSIFDDKKAVKDNNLNKSDETANIDMGCGCGCKNKTVEAKMEDYLFSTPEGAEEKSMEIGFDGEIHESTLADGTKIYSPAKTEEEFIEWYRKNDPDAEEELSAAEPTPSDNETHDAYMTRCQEAGYSEEECMKAHEGHNFKEAGYGDSCPSGETMKDGKCIKVAVTTDVTITDISMAVEASSGKTIVEITGVAFHEGTNKNGWSITRMGAEQLLPQMIGADVTLNHPTAENGRFGRNMDGGIDEAVVGVITDAFFDYHADNESWDIRFKASIVRKELFEALESGLWLRDGYGVSIGGTGIPDEIVELEDGQVNIVFESDFTFDHLAIVHQPAYDRARIDTAEKVIMPVTVKYQPESPQDNGEVENMTSSETENNSDEGLLAEIESLKADLILRNAEIEAFQAAEQAKAESARQELVEKATEMGLKGHDDLSTEVISELIASWEASRPQEEEPVVMEPVVASTQETEVVEMKPVVANYFNKEYTEVPEELYAKAYNVWVSAWNGTLTPQEKKFRAKTYEQTKEMN